MFNFLTSLVSLVGIGTLLYKMGGGDVVYWGWGNFRFIFIGLVASFSRASVSFSAVFSLEKPREGVLQIFLVFVIGIHCFVYISDLFLYLTLEITSVL